MYRAHTILGGRTEFCPCEIVQKTSKELLRHEGAASVAELLCYQDLLSENGIIQIRGRDTRKTAQEN